MITPNTLGTGTVGGANLQHFRKPHDPDVLKFRTINQSINNLGPFLRILVRLKGSDFIRFRKFANQIDSQTSQEFRI